MKYFIAQIQQGRQVNKFLRITIHYMYYNLRSEMSGPEIMYDSDFPEVMVDFVIPEIH